MNRPNFSDIRNSDEFLNWYWDKEEMTAICKEANLPVNGNKDLLRKRILHALDYPGIPFTEPKKKRTQSKINWSKADLDVNTVITDNITFGPNVRRFFQNEIGNAFVCHSDFMNWVKANVGATLGDAIEGWEMLESRKADPSFRREIAFDNMMNQYIRQFFDANPNASFSDALNCWKFKKTQPMQGGRVVYDHQDIEVLQNV